MAIVSYKQESAEDILLGYNTKQARRTLPRHLHALAQEKLAVLNAATSLLDLRRFPGNKLELLRGERRGQFSLRINAQYRICFQWENQSASKVEIVDYH